MANRAAAMRYARALFSVCEQEGELERVARELAEFASVMDEHQLLRKSLLSPAVPPGPKRVLMETLLGRSEGYSERTVRLLTLLAERDRLSLLGEILEVYGERLMEHDGVVRARITTAAPLPTAREQAITEQLGTATGKKVAESGGPSLKRLTLELGGNDAAIVLDDAKPLKIAEDIFNSAMANTGQICAAIKRLYVHKNIYEEMCDALKKIADNAIVGDGFEQGIDFGPLQNKQQYEKVKNYIEEAKEKGKVISGGEIPNKPGYFIPITLIRDVEDGLSLVDEEQFGPVLPIIKFNELDEVVEKANASKYGLGGSVWSENTQVAKDIAQKLEAGSVWINHHAAIGPDIPLAGAKDSGIGVEWGEEGLNEFSQIQIVNVKK